MRLPLAFGFTLLQGAILASTASLAHDIHAKPDAKVPPPSTSPAPPPPPTGV